MIDNIKIVLPINLHKNFWKKNRKKVKSFGIEFRPNYNYTTGDLIKYIGSLENLRLEVVRGDKLVITKSWHKFFKGDNHSDFSFTDLKDTVFNLEERLGLLIKEAEIMRFEYGCNIEAAPEPIYQNWQFLHGDEGIKMKPYHSSKVYGHKFSKTEYSIKCYDKKYESKIDSIKALTRIEVEVKRLRHIQKGSIPIPIYKVKDLLIKDNLALLGEDLLKKYRSIKMYQVPNFKGLTAHQANVWAAMNNNQVRKHFKKDRKDTYKNYNKILKEIQKSNTDVKHQKLVEQISTKWKELLNG